MYAHQRLKENGWYGMAKQHDGINTIISISNNLKKEINDYYNSRAGK
jgi:hypothetical protein